MFKTIMNLGRVVKDITVIGSKEAIYQASKANDKTTSATGKLADRTASLRQQYEEKLKARKAKCNNDPNEKVIEILPAPQQEKED